MSVRTPGRDFSRRALMILSSVTAAVVFISQVALAAQPPVEEGFDGDGWHADWAGWYPGALNRAGPGIGLDGNGLLVTIPPGAHYGTRFSYPFRGEQPETLYFRYYLRFAGDFSTEGTGKLPGPVGIYNGTALGGKPSTEERPGWSARMQFGPGPEPGTTQLGYYTYHLDQPGRFGQGMSWGPNGLLTNGDWYCIEGAIDLNTPGEHDGVLRGWVDESLAIEQRGLAFRRAGEEHIRISAFWFNVYFGGKQPSQHAKQIVFDNVAVGAARIGCGGEVPVAVADIDGDGRDDAIELTSCAEGRCWTVEPGDPLAFAAPTTVPSDARAGAETIRRGIVTGAFDGDGRDDVAYVGRCAGGGRCWLVHPSDGAAPGPVQEWGVPPFYADIGQLLAGDVNGDGLDDIVARSACDGRDCWLVQFSTGTGFAAPTPAGDGAYFSESTEALGIGLADVTGDGMDDLVYRGFCGKRRPCWRVQQSTGAGFASGMSWGNTTGFAGTTLAFGFRTGDLNGDGRDDILYRGECGEAECWRALIATPQNVFAPRYWGSDAALASAASSGGFHTADVDANGLSDLVYRIDCDAGTCWDVKLSTGTGFMSAGTEPIIDHVEIRPAFLDGRRFRTSVLS